MSESNWASPALKPSRSSSRRNTGAPPRTSNGPACSRSPRGASGNSSRGAMTVTPPCTCTHARTAVPRRGERDVAAGHAARADLAQRHAVRAHEEAADERLLVAARGAPRLEPGRAAQDRDADLGARRVVGGDVDRGPGAVEQARAVPGGRGLRVAPEAAQRWRRPCGEDGPRNGRML